MNIVSLIEAQKIPKNLSVREIPLQVNGTLSQ